MFFLHTLGIFSLRHDDTELPVLPTKKARALLVYLIMHRASDVSREQLVEVFWPDFEPERARQNLKVTLWSIRRMLRNGGLEADRVIVADRTVVRWTAPVECDAEYLVAAARDNSTAAVDAVSLYHGDFLEGNFDDWVISERERTSSAYERLLGRVATDTRDVEAAEQLVGRNPYDETAYATLIEAELGFGRPASAALLVQRCRAALAELNAAPSLDFEQRFGSLALAQPRTELSLPFVGREAELRSLHDRFDEALSGSGSVTIVGGDAGIGKSALVHQAISIAMRLGLRVIELNCTPDEPWIVRDWNVMYESLTGQQFEELATRAGFDVAARAALALAHVLVAPSLLVIEDFHNLSGDALALCAAIVETLSSNHCILVTSRPEALAGARGLAHRSLQHNMLPSCLDETRVASALRQATGIKEESLARVLYKRTAGHPLYLTRLLEALVIDGSLRRGDSGWTLARELDASLPLPETLTSFIESRLSERGKIPAMLASALALEPMATADELGSVVQLDDAQLLDALDDLLALGIVRQPPAGPQFQFSHDLIAEVALSMLNAGRRVQMHRSFAENLKDDDSGTTPRRLARHLLASGNVVRAGAAFVKACEHALKSSAANDCMALCEQAITSLRDLDPGAERDRLLSRLHELNASAHLATGSLSLALDAATQSISLARTSSDPDRLSHALNTRTLLNTWLGNTTQAISDARENVGLANTNSNHDSQLNALLGLCAASRIDGNRDAALRFGREACEAATDQQNHDLTVAAAAELLLISATWWSFQDGLNALYKAADSAQRANPPSLIRYYHAVCAFWHVAERNTEARRAWSAADALMTSAINTEIAEIQFSVPARFFHAYMRGVLTRELSEWGEGLAAARVLESLLGKNPPPLQSNSAVALIVDALLARGEDQDLIEAAELCERVVEHGGAQQVVGFSTCAELVVARIMARTKHHADNALLRNALDAVEQHAYETPLLADAAFADLAEAARYAGNDPIERRARDRSEYFRSKRLLQAVAGFDVR